MRPTPVLSQHARDRCAEMEISTKVAKRIVQHAELCYPGMPAWSSGADTVIYRWKGEPRYVVCCVQGDPDVVISVLFNTPDFYERAGATFISLREAA